MVGTSTPATSDADMARARELLLAGGTTVAAVKGDVVLTSMEKGVRPLMEWVSKGISLEGFSVADKVVGKAPALLYCLLRARAVYAPVMSLPAKKMLEERGIAVSYDVGVNQVLNARRTGQCPVDASVADIDNPEAGLEAIGKCLERLAGTGGPAASHQ